MRKIYAIITFLFLSQLAIAQNDRYWVGASGGSWSAAANWSLTNGGAGGAGSPTSVQIAIFDGYVGSVNYDLGNITIGSLKIINAADVTLSIPVATARTVSINDALSTNQDLRVDVTSKLTLTTASGISAQFALTPSGALVDGIIILKGSVAAGSGGRIDASSATTASPVEFNGTIELQDGSSNTTGLNFKFNSGSLYIIKKNGGTVPSGVWDANAEVQYLGLPSGSTTSAPSFGGPPAGGFGRFIYNVPNQSQTINLALTTLGVTFNGDFQVLNTNGQALRLASTLTNLLVKGNFVVSGTTTRVNMTNSSSAPTGNVSLTVNGDFQLNGGTFDLQENTGGGNSYLKLKGGLSIAGGTTFTATGNSTTSTHEVEFTGTAAQSVSMSGSITGIPQFRVNGAGLTASTNITLPATTNCRFFLTSGNVNMGVNTLIIQNPSAVALAGGVGASHIIGRLRRATNSTSTYLFPVGTASSPTECASVKINPAGTTATTYEIFFSRPNIYDRSAVPSPVVNAGDYYWDITRPTGAENADLTFVYGQGSNNFASGNSNAEADLRVLHWNGASWDNFGGSGTGGEITASGVFTFSPFTLGTVGAIGLPVTIKNFSGSRNNSGTNLKWIVAQEQDVKHYSVERSTDGRIWSTIATVNSLGNTSIDRVYSFTDNVAITGRQHYRLRVVENGGAVKLSNVVMISDVKTASLAIVSLYPNPAVDKATLQLQSPVVDNIRLSLIDAFGRTVWQQHFAVQAGVNPIDISLSKLAKGSYILRGASEKGTAVQQSIVKQ